MQWWKHAFAIAPAAGFTPSAAERELADRVHAELSRRGLTLPAIVLLESFRPLGYLASQAVWFSHPLLAAVTRADGWQVLGEMLERPGSVDWLIDRWQLLESPGPVTASRTSEVVSAEPVE